MKHRHLIWVALAAFTCTACDVSSSTDDQPSATGEAPADFSGTYAMGYECNALVGTMSINADTIRVTETVCQIKSAQHVNTSSTKYILEDCLSEGDAQPDRTAIISEVEDGQVLLSGWVKDDFTFNMCS